MKKMFVFWIILLFVFTACSAPLEEVVDEVETPEPQDEVVDDTPEPDDTQEETETEGEAEEEPEDTGTGGDDVQILGKDGFDMDDLKVSKGATVTWFNAVDKDVTVTFFKDGRFFQNSPLVKAGEKFEITFDEEGSYEYWSVAFGVKAKVTVG